jgi:hypothetical protein
VPPLPREAAGVLAATGAGGLSRVSSAPPGGGTRHPPTRFEEAISAHQDAAAIYRQAGNRHREETALNNLESARAAVVQLLALQDQRATDCVQV